MRFPKKLVKSVLLYNFHITDCLSQNCLRKLLRRYFYVNSGKIALCKRYLKKCYKHTNIK